jgi:site-specific DNA recombinase
MGATAGARIRAAIYCRLSRKGGRSVERQEQDGRRIARDKGWDVVAVYREWASASPFAKKAREEWVRLLAAVERGEFDAIILWMEDRSARDVVAAGEFVQACKKAGLENVVLPSYDYDLSDQEDVAKFYGEVLAGQREAAKTSKRTRRARQDEADNGHRHPGGRRAFGEPGGKRIRDPDKDDDDPEKWLTDEQGRWRRTGGVPDEQVEAERKLIREAADRIVAGDSLRGIVGSWNRKRIKGPTGGRWGTRPLRQMLLSPRLAGYREHLGQVVTLDGQPVRLVDGPSLRDGLPVEPVLVDPILKPEQCEAVREILTDPGRTVTAVGRAPSYLLTGLIYCGECGARMGGVRRRGRTSYRCPGPADGGGTHLERAAAPIEDLILRALFRAVESSPKWGEQAAKRPADDPTRPHYERLAELTAEIDVLDRRIGEADLAEELGRRPHPSAATLRRMLADREVEQEQRRAAVARLQHGRVAAAVPRNLRTVWPSLSLDRQRAILKAVLKLPPEGEGIVVQPQGRGYKFDPDAIKPDWRV